MAGDTDLAARTRREAGVKQVEAEVEVDQKHVHEWVMSPQGVTHETWDDQPPWVSPQGEGGR